MSRNIQRTLAMFFVLAFAPAMRAQAASRGQDEATTGAEYYATVRFAREALERKDFDKAAAFFQKAIKQSQDNPGLYRELGHALYKSKRYEAAANAYETARRSGFYELAASAVQIAACYALAGKRPEALQWLEEALRSRLKERSAIAQDERFAALKDEARFQSIIGALPSTVHSRAEGWAYDLDFLVSEIHRLNPAYERFLPPDFQNREHGLRKRLSSMTDQEIALEIMALLASLHQAHTVMAPFGMQKGTLGLLPVQLYAFSDGIFVVNASERDMIGARVLQIGRMNVSDLSARLQAYISRDNDQFLRFAVPIALTWPDLLKVVGATVNDSLVEMKISKAGVDEVRQVAILKAIDPDKLQMKLIAPVNASGPPPDYLCQLDRNFWLKKLDDSTLYVQFNQFVDEPSRTLDGFAIELHHAAMEHAVRNVVVDLRFNNGGDYSSTLSILKALFAFEMGRPDSRLFVVVGRNTESAAQNFASTLDEFGHVIIVGEPSGSKPNHVGDDTFVVLPYSGIIASIACAIHQTEFRDERQWIAPDIPISLSSDAYFSQRDPTMEAIAEVIKHE